MEIFVGVGAARVRDLFSLAKEKSPSIIFIDEIDAVGRKRSGSHGSHDERDNTLNQILVEMDGFETSQNVIVMAATNRQNLLDEALIRPGRFDRLVEINLPDLEGRRQIFNVHLEKVKVESSRTKDEYSKRLATLTPGFSGAEIANLCNEAAILAARHDKTHVDSHDLEMATERIIGGVERKSIITKDEKKIVSVHESGHAVVSWFLKGADPLLKLTIIPRSKGSLGFAQYFVNETKLNTKSQLIDRICFILGGRCAEELFFGKVTNGAADDLKKAYELAHNIVVKLGMNEEIGYIGYKDTEYLRPYSEEMGARIDREIIKILDECTERTQGLVRQYEKQIRELSEELYEKETLTIREIRRILGERDFTTNSTYEQYL